MPKTSKRKEWENSMHEPSEIAILHGRLAGIQIPFFCWNKQKGSCERAQINDNDDACAVADKASSAGLVT